MTTRLPLIVGTSGAPSQLQSGDTLPVAALPTGATSSTVVIGNDSRFTTMTANNQTGTSYSLVLADAGLVVECNNAGAIALTVTKSATVAWAIGTIIEVWQQGAGQVTLTPDTGVTFRSDGSKVKTAAQYATVSLRYRATDEWVLSGDLA